MNYKKSVILILAIISEMFVNAQDFKKAVRMGSIGDDQSYGMAIDHSGNIYTTGSFRDTVDFDPGTGTYKLAAAASDIFVSKTDSSGNFIWAKRFGGSSVDIAYAMALDKNGNAFITGTFRGTSDFDPDTLTYNVTAKGQYDIFVLKLDLAGNLVWIKNFGAYGKFCRGNAITVDSSGNVYSTGEFQGTVDFNPGLDTNSLISFGGYDIFISKLNTDGNFIWAKNMGGTQDEWANGISVNDSGNVYTTGLFQGTSDFDPGTGVFNLQITSLSDAFILKLNANGNFAWAKKIAGNYSEIGKTIVADALGNTYIGGVFNGPADFDPGAGVYTMSLPFGNYTIWLLKLDVNGNFVWAKCFGGSGDDFISSTVMGKTGKLYHVGSYKGTVDFDPGAGTFSLNSTGNTDIYITTFDSSGNFIWARSMGGTSFDYGYAGALDDSQNVYASGCFIGTADFDPDSGNFSLVSAGNNDIFVLKLTKSNCLKPAPAGSITGPSAVCEGESATYSINSIAGATAYNWVVPAGAIIFSGQNSFSINIKLGSTSGNVAITPANSCGSGLPSNLGVTVKQAPSVGINIYPDSVICNGTSIILNGTGALSYVWSNGVSNGISFIPSLLKYVVTGTAANGCKNYDSISIIINPKPTISKQPTNQLAAINANVVFICTSSNPPVNYQWQENKGAGYFNLTSSGQYTGVTNDTLTISNITLSQNNYNYRCLLNKGACFDSSNSALLQVISSGMDGNTDRTNFEVYPNPSNETITVLVNAHINNLTYTLTNLQGTTILKGTFTNTINSIDLSSLAQGLYFMNVGSGNIKSFKLIKQ